MRITSLALSGWMPFQKPVELALPHGPIAIVGTHANDPRRSNRAGKTALLEAVTWCLYGLHRKRLDDAIINQHSDECEVVLTFEGMTIQRSRKRGKSTKVLVTMHEVAHGVRLPAAEQQFVGDAAEHVIRDYIGLSSQDYLATLCFRQGDVESIITRTAGERLALVSEWLQQARWLDAKRLQSAKTNLIVQELAVKRESHRAASGVLMDTAQEAQAKQEVAKLKKEMTHFEKKMSELHSKMKAGIDAEQALRDHDELAKLRAEAGEFRKEILGGTKLQKVVEEKQQEHYSTQQESSIAQQEYDELAKMQRDGFDGRCPVSCEMCPVKDHVSEVVRVATDLLSDRKETLRQCLVREHSASVAYSKVMNDSKAHERQVGRYNALLERGKTLAGAIPMSVEEARSVPSIEPLRAEHATFQERYNAASRQVAEIEATLKNADRDAERAKKLEAEVAEHELRAQVAQLALRAIASVPARIAAEQLGELEREANMLLSGSGVSLRFSWARELADKSPLCEECGHVFKGQRGDKCPACEAPRGKKTAQELELLCDDGSGAEEDVRYNSGGTRALVGSSIRLAASSMLRRLRSTEAAWAIVDEPFGSLDAENREQLARTFAGMLGSVGFDQALVVSHDPLLLGALPHRIVIDKDGNASTARLE